MPRTCAATRRASTTSDHLMSAPNPTPPHAAPLVAGALAAVREVLANAKLPAALHEPEFAGREREYVNECIDTGWVSSVGAFVDRFERDLAAITGARFAIATSNGTAALHICL